MPVSVVVARDANVPCPCLSLLDMTPGVEGASRSDRTLFFALVAMDAYEIGAGRKSMEPDMHTPSTVLIVSIPGWSAGLCSRPCDFGYVGNEVKVCIDG